MKFPPSTKLTEMAPPTAPSSIPNESSEKITLTPKQHAFKVLRENLQTLDRAVKNKETRLFLRVMRTTFAPSVRKHMQRIVLFTILDEFRPNLLKWLNDSDNATMVAQDDEMEEVLHLHRVLSEPPKPREEQLTNNDAMDVEMEQANLQVASFSASTISQDSVPEVSVYLQLLILVYLLDSHKNARAADFSKRLFDFLHTFNRRTLDWLSAKVYFYYELAQERIGDLESIRPTLLKAHRSASLQHNEPGQAALTVGILRNYLKFNLYSAADSFRLKSIFPESKSNNLLARYLYYVGRIEAMQLNYSSAHSNLAHALRKAPARKGAALGFRLSATKLDIIVHLLMGEIPDKSIFNHSDMRKQLLPYYELTKAVRVGDLEQFGRAVAYHRQSFENDGVASFLFRLRNNVIRAGLRKISLAYSRISLSDIASKLGVENAEDAEYVVVKAIADGVIDASVNHAERLVTSNETLDVYTTSEPQAAFHQRIVFCLSLHNEAVESMRFPSNINKMLALTEAGFDDEESADEEGNAISRKKPNNKN